MIHTRPTIQAARASCGRHAPFGVLRRPAAAALLVVAACAAGCADNQAVTLRQKVVQLESQLQSCENDRSSQQAQINKLQERLTVARAITPEELKKVFHPEQVKIAQLSGGVDYDGQPGDDGVNVYLQPIDQYGDVLKAAGDTRIELYDLANPPGQQQIGVYTFPVDEAAKNWFSFFGTYQYTFKCPWKNGPPKHDELTIRVVFVDFLTQRVMTAQATCSVRPRPAESGRAR